MNRCYQELLGSDAHSIFNLPAVTQCPGPVLEALQQCHQVLRKNPGLSVGAVRVRGSRGVRFPGRVMKLVVSTCPARLEGPTLLFEPSEGELPAGLLAVPCLAQGMRGTIHIPVINVGTVEVVLYPQTRQG